MSRDSIARFWNILGVHREGRKCRKIDTFSEDICSIQFQNCNIGIDISIDHRCCIITFRWKRWIISHTNSKIVRNPTSPIVYDMIIGDNMSLIINNRSTSPALQREIQAKWLFVGNNLYDRRILGKCERTPCAVKSTGYQNNFFHKMREKNKISNGTLQHILK